MKHPDPSSSNLVRSRPDSGTAIGTRPDPSQDPGGGRQGRALEALRQLAETDRRVKPPALLVASVKRLPQLHGLAGAAETPRGRLILGFDGLR